jgi:hypothetical protein
VTPSWREIKKTIRTELLSRELAQPRTRLAALDHVEKMLGRAYPRFDLESEVVLSIPEVRLRQRLGAFSSNGRLNGAEKSVLHNIYQVLRGDWIAVAAIAIHPLSTGGRVWQGN